MANDQNDEKQETPSSKQPSHGQDKELLKAAVSYTGLFAILGILIVALLTLLSKMYDGLGGRFDKLEGRFDRLETSVASRLDRMETRIDRVDQRLDRLEQRLGTMKEDADKNMTTLKDEARSQFQEQYRALMDIQQKLNTNAKR